MTASGTTPPAPPGLAPRDILRLGDGVVEMLDQTRLPGEVVTVTLLGWEEVVDAIRAMVVRGAPAIGVAGAMGVALAARRAAGGGLAAVKEEVARAAAALRDARPTAVNLSAAVDGQAALAAGHPGPPEALAAALADAARALHADEVERCERMGGHALGLISRGARILTHCNTGALATGGYGTALGVVRAAFAADPTVRVVVAETRPLLQGARLTAWELEREGIPYTLIADVAAATLMASGRVTHVVVGADRIAANGDVVNKVGTYGLAILAREHGIPLIVAAPTTTLDPFDAGRVGRRHRGAGRRRGAGPRPLRPPGGPGGGERGQPRLRRDARAAGLGHRDRGWGAPPTVRALAPRGGRHAPVSPLAHAARLPCAGGVHAEACPWDASSTSCSRRPAPPAACPGPSPAPAACAPSSRWSRRSARGAGRRYRYPWAGARAAAAGSPERGRRSHTRPRHRRSSRR